MNLELTRSGKECRGDRVINTVLPDGKFFAIYDSEPEDLPV